MKISQLVKKLSKWQKKHGDLDITVINQDSLVNEGELAGVRPVLCTVSEDTIRGTHKVTGLMLVDNETACGLD